MVNEFKKTILDYCKTHGGTSFAELDRLFEEAGLDYKGNECLCIESYNNVFLWFNWNADALQAFRELLGEEIYLEPCPPFIYLIDGLIPGLPIAEGKSYKKPHWAPYWIQMR